MSVISQLVLAFFTIGFWDLSCEIIGKLGWVSHCSMKSLTSKSA